MSKLTSKKKAVYLQIIISRDGFKCFYCKQSFVKNNWIYEHLDNNPNHSEVENIVLAHQSCNLKKRNDCDMQIMAMEKLKLNHQVNLSCERESVELEGPTLSPEMDTNMQNFEITEQYITEIIQTDTSIEAKNAINAAAMLCHKKTGSGSTVAIRRYIDMLTSSEGPFMFAKNDEGKKIIIKRSGK
ncbi:HNH endonuclease [Nitrosopumilus piranensis]|uniref:HNH nuclease domain-containing protein n=1 Tax=Nitrosopumilus piranensis TaxID=1582439 RepID=A0A0C5BXM0_9ARCH|nr:HNH endonuclease [Nitrosopumilus piranensis]AJM91715.1 hypothetical protein NPIRD3C_0501 [Nitrosopumilus piranensis]